MSISDLTQPPATDPLEIYRLRDGFYATDLLAAALVHLDLFSHLSERPSSLVELCRDLRLARRPTDVMLTLFTALDLIEPRDNAFHLTALAREHLVKSSPWFIGPYYAALKDRPVCLDYVNVLRTDKPANWGSYKNEKDWTQAMKDPSFADQFTAAMISDFRFSRFDSSPDSIRRFSHRHRRLRPSLERTRRAWGPAWGS